jgi:hypothetical protein
MAAKKQAAKAGAGVWAASKAVQTNPYLQRVVEDEDLRENLRQAFESTRRAYGRMANGKGPTRAILDDRKTQKELRKAAGSLSEAAESLRGVRTKRRRRRRGGLVLLLLVAAGAAIALSEDLRKHVLDLIFGAEEEFEYTSTTSPPPSAGDSPGATGSGAPAGPGVGTS